MKITGNVIDIAYRMLFSLRIFLLIPISWKQADLPLKNMRFLFGGVAK